MAERRSQETDGGRQAARDAGQAERNVAAGESQAPLTGGETAPSSPRPMPSATPASAGAGPGEGGTYEVDAELYMGGHGPLTDEMPQQRFGVTAPAEGGAEEREKRMARSRGVPEEELEELEQNTIWIVSNRADDRVVMWERDPKHPGGEIVVGGSGPIRAYRTPSLEERIFRGEVVEVPEPKRTMIDPESGEEVPNRKFPPEPGPDPAIVIAAQPGRPTPLGRRLDPELWDEDARKQHARKLRGMPSQMPVPQGAIVPTVGDVERRAR